MTGHQPASKQPSDLAKQAAHRELVALVDGPWAPAWFWRDELEAMQASSRRMGHPDEHEAAWLRHYQPTGQWVDHPSDDDVRGHAWHYHPPVTRSVGSGSDATQRVGELGPAGAACVCCGQELLLIRPGRVRCERCRLDGRETPAVAVPGQRRPDVGPVTTTSGPVADRGGDDA